MLPKRANRLMYTTTLLTFPLEPSSASTASDFKTSSPTGLFSATCKLSMFGESTLKCGVLSFISRTVMLRLARSVRS